MNHHPPLQRRFIEIDLAAAAKAPLISVEGLRALTGQSEDDVLHLIEDGQLPWAFDIAAPNTKRMELRVWRGSLNTPGASLGIVLDDVLGRTAWPSSIPEPLRTIEAVQLQRRWVCSSTHIHHLIAAGCLHEAGGGGERKQTHTRHVTRASAEAFLTERRQA